MCLNNSSLSSISVDILAVSAHTQHPIRFKTADDMELTGEALLRVGPQLTNF